MAKKTSNAPKPPFVIFIPPLDKKLFRPNEGDPWLRRANEFIADLNELARHTPSPYGWRFRTAEAFEEELREMANKGCTSLEINRFYWVDILKTCEAYTVMTVWRSVELIRAAVRALNRIDPIVAAILARSALENSAAYVDAARKMAASLEAILKHDFAGSVLASPDIEQYLLKTVFASRLPGDSKAYDPTSILTILARISKTPAQELVVLKHGVLSEVTHPNFLGRSIYIQSVETKSRPGDELRLLALGGGLRAAEITETAIWALAWAAATQVSAAHLMQGAAKAAYTKML